MQFGSKQLEIMRVLWRLGRANAKQVADQLDAAGTPMAHSTVQTQLRLLMKKHAIDFEKQDRTFVFFPLVKQTDVASDAAKDLLDRVFDGSASALVSHLLGQRAVKPDEVAEIRRLLDGFESGDSAESSQDGKPSRKRRR